MQGSLKVSPCVALIVGGLLGCVPPGPAPSSAPPATPELSPEIPSAVGSASAPPDTAPVDGTDVEASVLAAADAAVDAPLPLLLVGGSVVPDGMLLVPAGPFTMGADTGGEDDEHPAHTVSLPAFWLDRTEVTNEAHAKCVDAKTCRARAFVAGASHAGPVENFGKPRQPVVGVSWDDAKTYCAWLGRRLPREAEFEKAIRDGDGRRYPWGNDPPTPALTVFARQMGHDATDEVGAHPSGRGPYGHDDLAGNVWEWIDDEYDPIAYQRATADSGVPGSCAEIMAAQNKLRAEGKQGFTGSNPIPNECEHVLRGGAFNYDAFGLRSTNRVHHPGRFRLVMTGFRCAKDAP